MSQVEMAVPERDVVPVTEALAASGVFHPLLTDGSRQAEDWQKKATTFGALERRILAVMEALDVDEGAPPSETPHLVEPEVVETEVEHLEQEAQEPLRELEEEQRRLDQLQRYRRQVETIAELEVDLKTLLDTRYIFVLMGTMPIANLERLETSLEFIPSVLVTLRHQDHLATAILFGTQRDAEILNRTARSAYLNPLDLPEAYRGTPAEAIAALKAGIERTRQRIADSQSTIERLHETRIRRLRHLLWRVRASRTLARTIAQYGRLRYTYLIAGWVPTSKMPTLEQKTKQVSDQVVIEVSALGRDENGHIPVALENPPLLKAFQDLVTNYGHPCYGELDPTPVLALTFPLVFGVMFGDVGHGLLLALLGLFLTSGRGPARREGPLHGLADFGPVLIACGTVAMLFGFLYGSVFGFEEVIEPLWLRPVEDIGDILLTTVGMGIGLLSLGMIYNIINAALTRKWGRLLFDHNGLTGMLFYWSLLGLGARGFAIDLPISSKTFAALVIFSGLALAFSEILERLVEGHRPLIKGSAGTYLMQALFELFETIIGLLSNTLSYVRMGAFAVAHGSLSLVVFIIAGMISPVHSVGYWIIVALGNLFVIGFEGMIVGIQTLRLEYYEFFSKFFSGNGRRHRPLSLVSKGVIGEE
jgi:V/A-type H+-transporting ATPase subunit I